MNCDKYYLDSIVMPTKERSEYYSNLSTASPFQEGRQHRNLKRKRNIYRYEKTIKTDRKRFAPEWPPRPQCTYGVLSANDPVQSSPVR